MDPSETVSTSHSLGLKKKKKKKDHCLKGTRLGSFFGLWPNGQRPIVHQESGELTVVLVIYWLAIGSRQQKDAGGWLEVRDAARVIAAADRHGNKTFLLPVVV